MKLLFIGDVGAGDDMAPMVVAPTTLFDDAVVIANLEGPIANGLDRVNGRRSKLRVFSTPAVIDVLSQFNVRVVSLANNHIFDLGDSLTSTYTHLRKAGIDAFGAGENLAEAMQPFVYQAPDTAVKMLGVGWPVIGCRPATARNAGVYGLDPTALLQHVRDLRTQDDSSFLAIFLHWNYELELYPQPAHRQLARDLITSGVDLVVGAHAHMAQGAECVDTRPVVYGLGNWYFPPRRFGQFELRYPPASLRQLAFEVTVQGRLVTEVAFHWFDFDPDANSLFWVSSEGWDGATLRALTPFTDLSHDAYMRWFRANRRKRRLLPIYADYRHVYTNRVSDVFVKTRQKGIDALVGHSLIRRPGA